MKSRDTVVTGGSVFPFKYSSAAILEIDYLQTALQMIFKFQKEICTLWSAIKKYSLFITNQSLQVSFILHTAFLFSLFIALFLVYILLSFSLPTVSLPLSTFHQQWLFSAQLPYALGTDLNHKKWESLINPVISLFLTPPTNPHLSSPLLLLRYLLLPSTTPSRLRVYEYWC